MRFEVSRVLDAIEGRLCTDPLLARGVLDLVEVARYPDLDGGRPSSLLRLGMVIDALGRHLAEDDVPVYAVVARGLMSDQDLTSNERMTVRRWADDGLVEVLQEPADRVLEVAELIGLPVLSRARFEPAVQRYPWLAAEPGRLLAPLPGAGGVALVPRVPGRPVPPAPAGAGPALLARVWRCAEPDCVAFGPQGLRTPHRQPPPRLRGGVPTCPRHETRLAEAGARPPAEVLAVRVDGALRTRFVLAAGRPVVVGRAPEEPGGIMLGHWLSDGARRWISRSHLRLELRGDALVVSDTSTNGTVICLRGSDAEADKVTLKRDQSRSLGPGDLIQPYPGVQIGRARGWASGGVAEPTSVMSDAPTMTIRAVPR